MTAALVRRSLLGGARAGGLIGMAEASVRRPVCSTTDLRSLVATGSTAIKDAILAARSRATKTQRDDYVRQLAKDLTRARTKCVEQIVALVIDIADRGSLEDAEEIGRQLLTIAREAHQTRHQRIRRTFQEIHVAEVRALSEAKEAELALLYEPTLANEERYLVKSARASRWRRQLDGAVRRMAILGGQVA